MTILLSLNIQDIAAKFLDMELNFLFSSLDNTSETDYHWKVCQLRNRIAQTACQSEETRCKAPRVDNNIQSYFVVYSICVFYSCGRITTWNLMRLVYLSRSGFVVGTVPTFVSQVLVRNSCYELEQLTTKMITTKLMFRSTSVIFINKISSFTKKRMKGKTKITCVGNVMQHSHRPEAEFHQPHIKLEKKTQVQ